MIRVETTTFRKGEKPRTTVLFVDEPSDELGAAVGPLLDALLASIDHPDPATLAIAYVAELAADAQAYEREAQRRGVLAL